MKKIVIGCCSVAVLSTAAAVAGAAQTKAGTALAPEARMSTVVVDGRSKGFRVGEISPESPLARFGLKPSDVLRNINGVYLVGINDLVVALEKVEHAEVVVIELERDETNTVLVYRVPRT